MDLSKVTRIHVVTEGNSPNREFWADSWEPHLQDDGRTLKLFAKGNGHRPARARSEALAQDLSQIDITAFVERMDIDQPPGDEALREFIEYVQPTLPAPLAEQARRLLEHITKGSFDGRQ